MDVNFTLETINDAARRFVDMIGDHKVIAFNGQMGAGKTTFIHAVCEELNVTDTVSSPTFSIINEYSIPEGAKIYHLDLYRIKDAEEAMNAGVEDCYYSGNLCLVEWPEKAETLLPDETIHCTIDVTANNARKLRINL